MRNQEGGRKGRRGAEKEGGRACRNSNITVYFGICTSVVIGKDHVHPHEPGGVKQVID